jgi:hypothetical protein
LNSWRAKIRYFYFEILITSIFINILLFHEFFKFFKILITDFSWKFMAFFMFYYYLLWKKFMFSQIFCVFIFFTKDMNRWNIKVLRSLIIYFSFVLKFHVWKMYSWYWYKKFRKKVFYIIIVFWINVIHNSIEMSIKYRTLRET